MVPATNQEIKDLKMSETSMVPIIKARLPAPRRQITFKTMGANKRQQIGGL
jgi:hypothetical protein